jgi:hypothetical protein
LPNDINLGDDLDFLTNAEFFDFDSFHPPNGVDFNHRSPTDVEPKGRHVAVNGATRLGNTLRQQNTALTRSTGPQYQFGEFQTYPPTVASSPASQHLHGQYPPQPSHQVPFGPQAGEKRKASVATSIPSPADLEEQSRLAAEEDKRRRNTAASARFRVKKKQREQALEKQAKEMTEKVQQLEGKVQQLEMENKWLKGLITDKNDGKSLETLQKEKAAEDRKTADNTDGVGTEDADAEIEA